LSLLSEIAARYYSNGGIARIATMAALLLSLPSKAAKSQASRYWGTEKMRIAGFKASLGAIFHWKKIEDFRTLS
jgi:hypothetical protein